jgi:hypothetical protein
MEEQDILEAYYKANPTAIKMLPATTFQCTERCKLWEHRKSMAFVCHAHRYVHWCGERCDHQITTRADIVCSLTGLVLESVPNVYQPVYSKSCRPVNQSHSFKRNGPSAQVLRMQRISTWIHTALKNILCSEKRLMISKIHRSRAVKAAVRAIKTKGTFSAVHCAAALVCIRAGNTLQQPAKPSDVELKILHKRLCTYIMKFKELKHTQRQVTAFVAACIQRLTTGMQVAGVSLFFKSPYVSAHAPAEMAHGDLCNVPCRQVSAMHRLIVTAALGVSGIPNPEYAF